MYENARSRVCAGCNLSEEFSVKHVKMGVHLDSCLSSLLFIMVLEALSQEFRTGCPGKRVYRWPGHHHRIRMANMSWRTCVIIKQMKSNPIITESLEELQEKLILWKTSIEGKGLWVNMGKTKVQISWPERSVLQKSGKKPCAMCLKQCFKLKFSPSPPEMLRKFPSLYNLVL